MSSPVTPAPAASVEIGRREFIKLSGLAAGAMGVLPGVAAAMDAGPGSRVGDRSGGEGHAWNGTFKGETLDRIAFPLGGIGAGMICIEGTGGLSQFSLWNRPHVSHEPCVFAALTIRGEHPVARVIEGPVPSWKVYGPPESARGSAGKTYGLPRFQAATFASHFPFATLNLTDAAVPLTVSLTAWSPFVPGDADNSSLPVAALEYEFSNPTSAPIEAVFSYNAANFMAQPKGQKQGVDAATGGFRLWGDGTPDAPWNGGEFIVAADATDAVVNHAWFRGGWYDPLTMAWKAVAEGAVINQPPIAAGAPSPGASLFVPFTLAPGASRKIVLRFSWHVSGSNLRFGKDPQPNEPASLPGQRHLPWYTGRFAEAAAVAAYWAENYATLRNRSEAFTSCFYDTNLPPEVVEAVAANLSILKSPTVLRQRDGRLWAWEGCNDESGCCHGSCTHVWNYAQAIPHLFPELERSLRETEFGPSQDDRGHQTFRAALPIRLVPHDFHAAADGQLGGIMKVFREWRIGGDLAWLKRLWPRVRTSLDYCIETWDPGRKGWLEEPHHNTYDIEFWGPDGMCTSIYLGALLAAVRMGSALGEDVKAYDELLRRGTDRMERELFDGEYYIQKVVWKGLRAGDPTAVQALHAGYSPEARALLEQEGPKYQYGRGCLSDGVIGAWFARVCGLGDLLPASQVESHLLAVHRHNLRSDLSTHANPQRPGYAIGKEGGLLLCSWPKGGQPALPFVYSNEVWTGIEYQVASHLMLIGHVDEGLQIVRACRARYDGRVRNPFDEYECGHWYARALASYAMLQGLSGARYDAVDRTLYLVPSVRGDYRAFIATATGFGTVGVRGGKPFLDVKSGTIAADRINYTPRA